MKLAWIVLGGVLGLGAFLLAFSAPVVGSLAPYSAYNFGPTGVSHLVLEAGRDDAARPIPALAQERVVLLTPLVALDPADVGGVLIVQPVSEPDAAEKAWMRTYLEAGGRILLAANGPEGNPFLRDVVQSRFMAGEARDLAFSRSPSFPAVSPRSEDPLLRGVERLVLNHPGGLRPGPGAEVLATLSPQAFMDADGNGILSGEESSAPVPWLVRERVGAGELLLLSDPNLLTNGMADVEGAPLFRGNLLAHLGEGGRVLVHEGHHPGAKVIPSLELALRSVPHAARLAFVAVGTALVLWGLSPRRERVSILQRLARRLYAEPPAPQPTREELRARLLAQHPDWDPDLLERVLAPREERA